MPSHDAFVSSHSRLLFVFLAWLLWLELLAVTGILAFLQTERPPPNPHPSLSLLSMMLAVGFPRLSFIMLG